MLALFAVALGVAWMALGAFAFLTNQSENVLTTAWQKSVKTSVQTVLPEQWGFFTRSPREDELLPYTYDGVQWVSASVYPHSRATHLFGWDRRSRAQGIEIGMIYGEIPDSDWKACDTGQAAVPCLKAQDPSDPWIPVTNLSPEPTLCGRIAISRALPPPWAWANIGQPTQEFSVILVEATC